MKELIEKQGIFSVEFRKKKRVKIKYVEAERLVHAKRSKYALVDLLKVLFGKE